MSADHLLPETIDCPLCLGRGQLSRTEVLERLGMKDFTRVAQLSAEEAIRLILTKEKDSDQARWAKFDVELTKRVADLTEKHQAEVQKHQTERHELAVRLEESEKNASAAMQNAKQHERLTTEKELQAQLLALNGRIAELEAAQKLADERKQAEVTKVKAELEATLNIANAKANDLDRRVKDYADEMNKLRDRNQELEIEMAKVARIGTREELDFAEDVRSWPGIWISDKLPRYGDYLIAFCDAVGNPRDPQMVLDNKDKACIAETDIEKLVRDAKERNLSVAVLVARDESQLRQIDRKRRWAEEGGIWTLRSTRAWLQRDLEILRPVLERIREEGPDFLQRNAVLAEEIRRTFVDVDEIEKELKKAAKAVESASEMVGGYRARLQTLCDKAAPEARTVPYAEQAVRGAFDSTAEGI
jgi:chromosome segregation ATPase